MAEITFRQELERLRQQHEQLQAAFVQLQQQQQPQVDAAAALASLRKALAGVVQAVVAAGQTRTAERKTLIDVKGLGRPQPLHNAETEFVTWARRIENFVARVMAHAKDAVACSLFSNVLFSTASVLVAEGFALGVFTAVSYTHLRAHETEADL
eukprot:5128933-Amphidinium_carterae.1